MLLSFSTGWASNQVQMKPKSAPIVPHNLETHGISYRVKTRIYGGKDCAPTTTQALLYREQKSSQAFRKEIIMNKNVIKK